MSKLYVVGTPIGNLSDLSPRLRWAFENCDLVAAEDTRVTLKLLSHLGISKPMISYHQHNEEGRAAELVERMLKEDLIVALACDAGTPAISDPGYKLVQAAWEAGIEVQPISGPSAVTSALSISGFDTREFAFYGFLPRSKKELDEKLRDILKKRIGVGVIYESPHRIVHLVERIGEVLPGAQLVVCCDLTKLHEKTLRGSVQYVLEELKQNPKTNKGEYCVVLNLATVPKTEEGPALPSVDVDQQILGYVFEGSSLNEAAQRALDAGIPRNQVYQAKLSVKQFLEKVTQQED